MSQGQTWRYALALIAGSWGVAVAEDVVKTVKDYCRPDERPVREVVYRRVGERDLRLFVYEPAGWTRGQGVRPAILMIHGGGWRAPGPQWFAPHGRYFSERGMVALNVEYRLADGTNTIWDCMADVRAAFGYVRAHGTELGADTNRVAVLGDSAGGHLAASLALDLGAKTGEVEQAAGPMPGAVILCNPVLDLEALPWAWSVPGIQRSADDSAEGSRGRAREASPLAHVRGGLPPILLVHGTADTCVPVEQADRFAAALKAVGNPVQYERVEGWPHAFVLMGYGPDGASTLATILIDRFLAGLGYVEGEPGIRMMP